jgi:hypothetical protein
MKPGTALRISGSLVVLALMGWAFVRIIWIPLYGHRETAAFAARQEEPAVQADIVREDSGGTRSWSVQDRQALSKLRDGLRRADWSGGSPAGGAAEPRMDQKFRLRIRRPDAHVDEYEVLLDERGSEHDLLYVVRRSGGAAVYGSAFKTPELRSALQQILKEPPAAPK